MNRLKEFRFNKSVTQYQLALLAQVQQSRISLIENGLIEGREDERQRIAKALSVCPEEIFPEGK